MINFTQAFDLAWERMAVILFRPFDLGKWCVIGFSAFLAGLLWGGNGSASYSVQDYTDDHVSPSASFNYGYHYNYSLPGHTYSYNYSTNSPFSLAGVMANELNVVYLVAGASIGVGIALLIAWLGSRGQFLLLDNLTRNRAAIAWPWRNYAKLGNSLFLFHILLSVVVLLCFAPLGLIGCYVVAPFFQQHRWPVGAEIPVVVVYSVICGLLFLGWLVVISAYHDFGVPLMFRNGLKARTAFAATLRLIRQHPLAILLFIVIRFALAVAFCIICVITCCFSCCVEAVPYVGTVLLLPAILFIRCFTLNYLAQFGPEYDVWTVDVPASSLPPAA